MILADGGCRFGANLAASSGLRLVIPEAQGHDLEELYHKDRFIFAAAHDTYTCPAGQLLTFCGAKQNGNRVYRGLAAVCRACPAFGICTTNWRQGRSLEVSPNEPTLRAHRAWMATDEAHALYRRRKALIDPVFGILEEQQGACSLLLRRLN